MKVFAIIVTYNGMRWIERCLNMLRESTVAIIPVVIDNASSDGTVEFIKDHFPETVVFPQDKNLGFGQANNVGLRYGLKEDGDYFLLLNQDAYLQPDAMEKMLEVSDGKSLMAPLHLSGEGQHIDPMVRMSLRNHIDRDARAGLRGENLTSSLLDDLFFGRLNKVYETTEICAACWLMPRSLIEEIGGFNPLFFHYSEDNNYYQRLCYHGRKMLLVPHAHVWHDRGIYGNVQAFNRRRLHRDFILELCNVNRSLLRGYFKVLRLLPKSYVYDLPKHNYRVGAWTYEFCCTLFHLATIIASRRQERKSAASWL